MEQPKAVERILLLVPPLLTSLLDYKAQGKYCSPVRWCHSKAITQGTVAFPGGAVRLLSSP